MRPRFLAGLALVAGLALLASSRVGASDTAFDAAYQAKSACEKQRILWRAVSAAPYAKLPRLGSAGVGETFKDTVGALRKKLLGQTFSDDSDVRTPRTKVFHPFGTVATVRFEPVAPASPGLAGGFSGSPKAPPAPPHPWTGLFRTGAVGLARLSLATDDDSFIPGIGLKLFVDGRPSVNVHAIPSFDGQKSRDFFERAPSNTIPTPSSFAIKLFTRFAASIADPLHRPVDALAAVEPDGKAVAQPRAPRDVFFRPAGLHFGVAGSDDFRNQLACVLPGTVIYEVRARDAGGPELLVGVIRTTSPFIASSFGDRELHFLHAK